MTRVAWRGSARLTAAWVALVLLYVSTSNPYSFSQDTWAASVGSFALAATGSPDVSPFFAADDQRWLFDVEGQVVTNRFPGAVLLGLPFYLLAKPFNASFSLWPGAVAAAVAAATSVVLMWLTLRRQFSAHVSVWATAFFALGTATWAISADAQWGHSWSQLFLVGAMLALSRDRLATSGLLFGTALVARPHLAVVVLVVAVWLGASRRSFTSALRLGLGSMPGVLALMSYNYWLFGRFSPINGLEVRATVDDSLTGGSGLGSLPENLAGFLFSPLRGVIVLYPVLLVVALWLPQAWRRSTDWEKAAAVGAVAYVLVQLMLNRFTGGGWFFGTRLSIEPLTLAFPLLLRAWSAIPVPSAARTTAAVLLGWTTVTHGLGAVAPPPCSMKGCAELDPWQSHDVVTVLSEGGSATALVLAATTGAYLLLLRLAMRPSNSIEASNQAEVAGRTPSGSPMLQ